MPAAADTIDDLRKRLQRWPLPARISLAAALVAVGIAGATLAFLRPLTLLPSWALDLGVLPYGLGVLLLALAVATLSAAHKANSRRRRVLLAFRAGAFAVLSPLGFVWPDVATLVSIYTVAVAVLVCCVQAAHLLVKPSSSPNRNASRTTRGYGATAALSVTALAFTASGIWLNWGVGAADSFYYWADPVPEAPGTLLRVDTYDGYTPAGSIAKRILYSTTYSDGSPAVASAVVAYPSGEADRPRPVLAWQHGTTGVAQICAPSVTPGALALFGATGVAVGAAAALPTGMFVGKSRERTKRGRS